MPQYIKWQMFTACHCNTKHLRTETRHWTHFEYLMLNWLLNISFSHHRFLNWTVLFDAISTNKNNTLPIHSLLSLEWFTYDVVSVLTILFPVCAIVPSISEISDPPQTYNVDYYCYLVIVINDILLIDV